MPKAKTKRKPATKPKATKKPQAKRVKPPAKKPAAEKEIAKKPAAAKPAPRAAKPAPRAKAPAAKKPVETQPVAARPARAKTQAGGWAPTGREWGPGSHLTRGMELHRAGKLVEARDAYERAIRTEDGGTFPKLQLLEVLDALHDIPAVLALVDELKGRGQTGRVNVVLSPVISSCEARARLVQKDFAAAEVAAREAVELDGTDPEAWRLVAVATAAQDRIDDALVAIDRMVALAPAWGGGHFMRGMYLHRAGRTPEAAAAAARATEIDREDGDAWYNLACYRALLGEKPEALYALAAAIRVDPENAALARDDGDFAGMARDHEFTRLTRASA